MKGIYRYVKKKLIALEGLDASGKSTQIRLLKNRFKNAPMIYTKEPSNGPIGRLIRREYLSGKRLESDSNMINKLCELDRIDHIINNQDGILKYLKEGFNVMCDRYILSTIAYSLYKNNEILCYDLYKDRLYEIWENFIHNFGIIPNLIIYLKINPDIAMDRIYKRNKKSSIYESSIIKLRDISKSYDMAIDILTKSKLCNIVSINAEDNKYNICNNIISEICRII